MTVASQQGGLKNPQRIGARDQGVGLTVTHVGVGAVRAYFKMYILYTVTGLEMVGI